MFAIEMLPAARGDCLWIEYGARPHRVLIDGGIASTHQQIRKRIDDLKPHDRVFDLLVITHIDLDHIAGVLSLLRDPPEGLTFRDVWFNGWEQLLAAEDLHDYGTLGSKLGERVSARLRQRRLPWNTLFDGKPVAIPDGAQRLPSKRLDGGMTLTLLSPTADRLRRLPPAWIDEIAKAKLEMKPGLGEDLEGIGHPEDVADEGILGDDAIDIATLLKYPFKDDTSRANASSIALLAEFEEANCLLLGDAYASDVAKSIRSVLGNRGGADRLKVGALKLSHHGGRKNTSPELLQLLDCPRFLFSTDGSLYEHPHRESVARTVVHGANDRVPTLYFNYRSPETECWDSETLIKGEYPYQPVYPAGVPGMRVEL